MSVAESDVVPEDAAAVFSRFARRIGFVSFSSKCTFSGTAAEVRDHASTCPCAPIPCRNSTKCGLIPADQMDLHLATCPHTRCRNHVFGCKERGEPAAMIEHEQACPFSNSPMAQQGRMLSQLVSAFHALVSNVRTINTRIAAMEMKQATLQRITESLDSRSTTPTTSAAAGGTRTLRKENWTSSSPGARSGRSRPSGSATP